MAHGRLIRGDSFFQNSILVVNIAQIIARRSQGGVEFNSSLKVGSGLVQGPAPLGQKPQAIVGEGVVWIEVEGFGIVLLGFVVAAGLRIGHGQVVVSGWRGGILAGEEEVLFQGVVIGILRAGRAQD